MATDSEALDSKPIDSKMDRRKLLRLLPFAPLVATAALDGIPELGNEKAVHEVIADRHYLIHLHDAKLSTEQTKNFEKALRGRGIHATIVAGDFDIYDIGAKP